MIKRAITVFIIISMVFTSGCWSRRELNRLAIIEAFGVDRDIKSGEIIVSHHIVKPTAKSGGGGKGNGGSSDSAFWTLTASGETLFDAIRKGAMQSSRRLYYGHNKVIVIGEEAAKEGVGPLLDLAGRDPELRPGVWIFIAKGETAADIIKAKSEQSSTPAIVLDGLAKLSRASSYSAVIHIEDFLRMLASETTAAYASRIEIAKRKKEGEQEIVEFKLSGAAVFRRDKLIGWLEEKETRGMLWVIGKVQSGIIIVKSPDNQNVGLEILYAGSKIKPEIREGKLFISIEITAQSNLGDSNSTLDLTTPAIYSRLNEQQRKVIENEVRACLEIAQKKYKIDLFGFGEAIHQNYPEDWKLIKDKWDEIYPTIPVELKIKTNINRYGMLTEPMQAK